MVSTYYTDFTYRAKGLDAVLKQFRAATKEIEQTSKKLGKITFTVNDAALKNAAKSAQLLNQELTKLGTAQVGGKLSGDFGRLNTVVANLEKSVTGLTAKFSSIGASASSFSQVSTSANTAAQAITKISTSANTAKTSSTNLASSFKGIGTSISASAKSFTGFSSAAVKAFATATSAALKFATTMSGAVTGSIGKAAAAMGGVATAGGRMGASALATAAAMPRNAALWAAPMATSMLQTILSPEILLGLTSGYGLYSYAQLEKEGSRAAAKSGAYGPEAETIKQLVIDVAQSFKGKSIYGSVDIAKAEAAYAAMGGSIKDLSVTKEVTKNTLDFAQAVDMELAPAMELLYSQALNWAGFSTMQGPEAGKAIGDVGDALTVLSNQTRLNADDLNVALKAVTPVAKTSGMDIAQTYAAVGTLSNLGRNPEEAGTDVRRLLLRLTPSYNALQQQEADELGLWTDAKGKQKDLSALNTALKELGLTYEDLSVKTQKGDIAGVIKDIGEAMDAKGWSDLEKAAYLKTQLGIQGTTPFLQMASDAGQEQYAALLEQLYNRLGISAKTAETQTNNLTSATKKLLENIKGSLQNVGKALEPSATKFVNYLNENVVPALDKLGGMISKGDWAGAGDMFEGFIDQGQNWLESLSEGFENALSGDKVSGALDWIGDIWDSIDWDQLGRTLENVGEGLKSAFETASSWLQDRINSIDWGEVESKLGNALETAGTWLENKINGINWDDVGTTIGNILTTAGGLLEKAIRAIPWTSIFTALGDAIYAAASSIDWIGAFQTAFTAIESIGTYAYNGIANSGIGTYLQGVAINFANTITMSIGAAIASLAGAAMKYGLLSPSEANQASGILPEVINKAKGVGEFIASPTAPHEALFNTDYNSPGSTNTGLFSLEGNVDRFSNFAKPLTLNLDERAKESTSLEKWAQNFWDSYIKSPSSTSGGAFDPFANSGPAPEATVPPAVATLDMSQVQVGPSSSSLSENLFSGIRESDQKELQSYYDFIQEEELPDWQEGTFECLQAFEKSKNDYKKSLLSDKDKTNDEYWKDLNLVNAEDSYHFLTGITPSGTIGNPSNTYLFDAAKDTYEGTIAKTSSDYNQESMMRLSTEYKNIKNDLEHIRAEKAYDFVPNTNQSGIYRDFGTQPGITPLGGGAGVGGTVERSYPGIERSPLVGQDAVDAVFKSASKEQDFQKKSSEKRENSENHKNTASTAQNTERVALSLEGMKSELSGLGVTQTGAYFSGTDPTGKSWQSPSAFSKDEAETVYNELIKKGYKITGVGGTATGQIPSATTQQQQQKTLETEVKTTQETNNLLKNFPSEIAAAFSDNGVDYKALSKAIDDVYYQGDPNNLYGFSAKSLEEYDKPLEGTSDDLITALNYILSAAIENRKVEEKVVENTKDTADNTKKSSDKSALKGFDTKKLWSDTFGTPDLSAIQDSSLLSAEKSAALAAQTASDSYGGVVRIGLDALGRQVAVIGRVAQQNWETGWANQEDLTGPSKNAVSLGNTIVPAEIKLDSTAAESKLAEIKTPITKIVNTKIGSVPDFSAIAASITKTVNVVTNYITSGSKTTTTPVTVKTNSTPKFHSGGVTPGSPGHEMLAILRGQERIVPLDSGSGRQQSSGVTTIHIHAEGATFVGNRGITQLAEEISRLQNDKAIFTVSGG